MIARRPIIAITSYLADARWGPWNQPAALVPRGYVAAVSRAGGRPVLLPPETGGVAETLAVADGLIFCGGPDLEPRLYGHPRQTATAHLAPERDVPELQLLSAALEADVPLLGICRGMQLLNVVRSGTLVQHLPDAVGHDGHATAPGHFDLHDVRTEPGTRTAAILGDAVIVHSGHHQGVGELGEGLVVSARAPDGVIEAIEDPGAAFALGVLWHPEQGDDPRLFDALVAAAAGAPLTALA